MSGMSSVKLSTAIAARTGDEFRQFRKAYTQFRLSCKLKDLKNAFEITTAMTDKLGRVAREVKHLERLDPRSGALETMRDSLAGLIVYSVLLADIYNVDIPAGLEAELNKAWIQHRRFKRTPQTPQTPRIKRT